MSIVRQVILVAGVARTLVRHPAVQAGIALAPLLFTPQAKARARDAALSTAYHAGVLARKVVRRD